MLSQGSQLGVHDTDGLRDDLSVRISLCSVRLVVLSGLLALVPSVGSLLRLVLDSLDGVFQGSLGKGDLILNTGEITLGVGKDGLGDTDGDAKESAGLGVGGNSLVLSASLEVEGVLDLAKELVDQIDDSANGALVSQLVGL